MGNKILNLRRRAEALTEFTKLPRFITHKKLDFYPNGKLYYLTVNDTWSLRLETVDGNHNTITMHKNNTGRYRLAYILTGYCGEEIQAIPFGKDELEEMKQYGTMIFTGGIYGDDIGDMIYRMKKWIEEEKTQGKIEIT